MKNSEHEKYLGHIVQKNGKQPTTIVERFAEGHVIMNSPSVEKVP